MARLGGIAEPEQKKRLDLNDKWVENEKKGILFKYDLIHPTQSQYVWWNQIDSDFKH